MLVLSQKPRAYESSLTRMGVKLAHLQAVLRLQEEHQRARLREEAGTDTEMVNTYHASCMRSLG